VQTGVPVPHAVTPVLHGFAGSHSAPAARVAGAASADRVRAAALPVGDGRGSGDVRVVRELPRRIHLNAAYVSGQPGLRHPAGNGAKLPGFMITNYNSYVVGRPRGRDCSAATPSRPSEGTTDRVVLVPLTGNVKTGPVSGQANVSCNELPP
jgi:hypothetical protein